MIKEIRFSEEFERAFKRLKKRIIIHKEDVPNGIPLIAETPYTSAS